MLYPIVSIVITTKNEEKNIENCLRSIKGQKYPADKIEVIVVDNFSGDRTRELAKQYTSLVYEKGPERSAQRNYGMLEIARGEYVMFVDADMILSDNVVADCVEKMSGDVDIVALYVPEKIIGEAFLNKVRAFERSFYTGTVIDGTRFFRRELFKRAGGFDVSLYACEDWDLDKKLRPFGRFDVAVAFVNHNETGITLRKYLKKKGYYSENINQYIAKWGKADSDIKKQFGLSYRFVGVFVENGRYRKLFAHPVLAVAMFLLRVAVGATFLWKK